MSDLRRRIHAAVVVPDSELDTEALEHRVTRRRHRRAAAVGAAALVVVLAAGGGVVAAQRGSDAGSLRTRGGSSEPTVPASAPEPSTTTAASTIPDTTVAPQGPGPTAGPGDGVSVAAAPTSGLGNFDDVTITATGIPDGSYDVGQCPASSVATKDTTACLLNAVVAVTDGRLTANVRALWWMRSGQIDCGATPGACIVGVMSTNPKSTFVPATFGLSFDPAKHPRIDVSPNRGLVDGQQVEVRGINIGSGSVSIAECLRNQSASCQYAGEASSTDAGFTATIAIQRVLRWGYHGLVDQAGECGVDDDCVIVVSVTPTTTQTFDPETYRVWIEPDDPVTLAFSPAPPTTTTTTTTTSTTSTP